MESSKYNKNSSEKVKSKTMKDDKIIPYSLLKVCKCLLFIFSWPIKVFKIKLKLYMCLTFTLKSEWN